jgi:hypothetical protein
MNGGGR